MREIDRARFRLHARLPAHRRRIEKSLAVLTEFLAQCQRPAISVSWGKDSLVGLHLIRRLHPDIDVLWCDRGEGGDMPETYALAERLTAEWALTVHRIPAARSIFEIYREDGTDVPRRVLRDNLVEAMDGACARLNIDGLVLGMRADEARGRRANLMSRGLIYRMASGQLRCNPLGFWTGEDIYAYIGSKRIPYLPIYDDLAAIGIDYASPRSRTSNWAGNFDPQGSGETQGSRFQVLRRVRPALWQRLVSEFPQFRENA